MKINTGNGYQPPVDPAGKQDPADKNGQSEKLMDLCQQFEAVFVHNLLKGMRATIPGGGLLEKGLDSEMIEEMRDLEVSKAISRHQHIGIADALYRQLSGLEKQNSDKSGD